MLSGRCGPGGRGFAAALMLVGLTVLAMPGSVHAGDIEVTDAWARAPVGAMKASAAYMTIVNHGSRDDRLVGARTPVTDKAALHTHSMTDGVMRMRPVEAIAVPAGGRAVLQPGGDHVMLMGIEQPLAAGDRIPLTLVFEHAGAVDLTLPVRPPGAAAD